MTNYTSDIITKNANRAAHGEMRTAQHAFGTAAIAVALAVNDTVQLVSLPPYARVTGACLSSDQLDSNGTPTIAFTLGDAGTGISGGTNYQAASAARYFTGTAIGRVASPADANANATMRGQAQNFYNNQNAPLIIYATCSAVAATFAAGNLYLRMSYYVDEPASGLNQ